MILPSIVREVVKEVFELPAFQRLTANDQALVLVGAWNSGHYMEAFLGFNYVLKNYAPEWVKLPDEFKDQEGVVTVFTSNVAELRERNDYRIYGVYPSREQLCPRAEHEDCYLCGGSYFISWGDDWRIVVLLPTGGGNA